MLKYCIVVTEDLIVPAILIGLLFGCIGTAYGRRGRQFLAAGVVVGCVAALVLAILRNTTKLISAWVWNLWTGIASIAALLVLCVFSLPALRKKTGGVGEAVLLAAGGVLVCSYLLQPMREVLTYPYTFASGTDSLLSSSYIVTLIGWILGLVLMVLVCLAACRVAQRVRNGAAFALMYAALAVNAVQVIANVLRIMRQRQMIASSSGLFAFTSFTSNHSRLFVYAEILIALALSVFLLLRSLHVNEPYENPAQHRKLRAALRSARRWSGVVIVCFILAVSNMTWVNALSSREEVLSPVEESEVRGDSVYVALEQVEDGHLHRFAYDTPSGKTVRFIVIKKPNSSSYGVGLDACDVCGETGYFERNGQIVCKLCDVVMNINTIGFKGGCNPIVIDYSVGDGYIIVPTATLIEHENEFK